MGGVRERNNIMPPSKAKQLGKLIRQARDAKGLTTRALAQAIGINHSTITYLEKGEVESPGIKTLEALSKALEIPFDDLYALAGYGRREVMPSLPVYLRSKYNLSSADVAELEEHFEKLRTKKKR
jgi:transcriptional regulator with XRE-family HTH domain